MPRRSPELVRPSNHRPSPRRRFAIRDQHHGRDGHVFSARCPRVIKNPQRRQLIREVVLVDRFRPYQFSRLARGERMWGVIKASQREGSGWPELLGSRCGLGFGRFWISGQSRQNQRNRGDRREKYSGSATSGGATRRPEQTKLCHVASKEWYHRKIPSGDHIGAAFRTLRAVPVHTVPRLVRGGTSA